MRSKKILFLTIAIACTASGVFPQVFDQYRTTRWRQFNKNDFHQLNFAKTRLTKARLAKLKEDHDANDFALLRGVIFGKHGRIFKERSIQDYLEKQAWYRPNKNYSNSVLKPIERANLDLIRLIEAEKHQYVEPGDMRIWRGKLIPDEKLHNEYTGAELTILAAEIEALHGKTFSEEWL